jgi:PIN domain nuclease of toxin-antitoxin system
MLLLDSQVVLWIADGNPRLGDRAAKLIMRAENVYVSSATVFELTIKSLLGKLKLPDGFITSLSELGFLELPIGHEDAAGIADFPKLVTRDPFDRLLLSQAKLGRLTLITADLVLLRLGYDFVLDAAK